MKGNNAVRGSIGENNGIERITAVTKKKTLK
jgi:hypothetical protein